MKVKAYAKLNLGLGVLGKREDGYHEISTLTTPISLADEIQVNLLQKPFVTVDMQNYCKILPEENSAYLAARKFFEAYGFEDLGARITISKHIPLMSGLGGSSADAAGTLYCLATLCRVRMTTDKFYQLASSCGADTLTMLLGGCKEVSGFGDKVKPVDVKLPLTFVVAFGEKCSTKKVFEVYDALPKPKNAYSVRHVVSALKTQFTNDYLNGVMINQLTEACCKAYPEQSAFIRKCTDVASMEPNLTGSGGAVFWVCTNHVIALQMARKLHKNNVAVMVCSPVLHGVEPL